MDRKPDKQEGQQISDAELEQFLSGDSAVSKAYSELGDEEPPARLDRAILDAARDHVKAPGQRWLDIDLRFWRHWSRPITTVVIMGFCLSVVLQIMETATVVPTEFNGDSSFADTRDAESLDTGALRRNMLQPGTSPADEAGVADMTAYGEGENYPEDITVNAREKVAATLKEMPPARASMPMPDRITAQVDRSIVLDEIIVDTRQFLADDALDAWERGARPTAEVWLAGIDALRAKGERDKARGELGRLALAYPDAIREIDVPAEMAAADAMYAPGVGDEPADSDYATLYPRPETWLAGIDWLENQKLYQKASIERDKFAQIYPQYPDRSDKQPQ